MSSSMMIFPSRPYTRLPHSVSSTLAAIPLKVLVTMLESAQFGSELCLSTYELANRCGMDRATVKSAIARLMDAGLIEIVDKGGGSTSTTWRITMLQEVEMAA